MTAVSTFTVYHIAPHSRNAKLIPSFITKLGLADSFTMLWTKETNLSSVFSCFLALAKVDMIQRLLLQHQFIHSKVRHLHWFYQISDIKVQKVTDCERSEGGLFGQGRWLIEAKLHSRKRWAHGCAMEPSYMDELQIRTILKLIYWRFTFLQTLKKAAPFTRKRPFSQCYCNL